MFTEQHYVPILKFRQGEYLALGRATAAIKNWLTPLFEIPLEQWDFETNAPAKSLDDHLANFGKRLRANWGANRCFVDSPFLLGDATMSNGTHHLKRLFKLARGEGCSAVPVWGLGRHDDYLNAVKQIVALDKRGACIRLRDDDFVTGLQTKLASTMKLLGVKAEDCDVVIDTAEEIAGSSVSQARSWASQLAGLPFLAQWRSLTVAAGSFPESLAPGVAYRPHKDIERREWQAYKLLIANHELDRKPTFGDYSACPVKTALMDPRLIDPNAKLKYTIKDQWRIVVGQPVKRDGRDQYRDLCVILIGSKPKAYEGAAYSWGDKFISECAAGNGNGGSSTWPTVSTSHHSARVVRDVARLFGASSIP